MGTRIFFNISNKFSPKKRPIPTQPHVSFYFLFEPGPRTVWVAPVLAFTLKLALGPADDPLGRLLECAGGEIYITQIL